MTKNKKLVWASAHNPTPEQIKELREMGTVMFLKDTNPELHKKLCNNPSTRKELMDLAEELLEETDGCTIVQPAGSPVFMTVLGSIARGVANSKTIMFALSKRVSKDIPQSDGTVKKISTFKHEGWI